MFAFLRKNDHLCYHRHPTHQNYIWLDTWEIISLITWKVISPWDNWYGYKIFFIYPWRIRYYVHRFILECFEWIDNTRECNHKNSDRSDNSVINLEYCTRKENMIHAASSGSYVTNFHTNHPDKWKFWAANRKSKVVYQYDRKTWLLVWKFWWWLEAKRITWVDNGDIWKCCSGALPHAGWFIWSRNYHEKHPIVNTN